jgi:hypothetical protein
MTCMDERDAMWRATLAARQVIAQSKNPRTTLGRMSPSGVAFHAAWAAVDAYRTARSSGLLPGEQLFTVDQVRAMTGGRTIQ